MSDSEQWPTSPLSSNGEIATLRLNGELTVSTVDELKDEFFTALNSHRIDLDLQGLTEVDSCGLQLLWTLIEQARQSGKPCRLLSQSPQLTALLAIYGLSFTLIDPKEDAA